MVGGTPRLMATKEKNISDILHKPVNHTVVFSTAHFWFWDSWKIAICIILGRPFKSKYLAKQSWEEVDKKMGIKTFG